jgi:hypothetical protein
MPVRGASHNIIVSGDLTKWGRSNAAPHPGKTFPMHRRVSLSLRSSALSAPLR